MKNRVCPEFTVLNIYIFNHSEFWTTCAEIFHCIEIFFIFQDFWATWACPENRVCPEFFKPGVGRPPPRTALVSVIVNFQRGMRCYTPRHTKTWSENFASQGNNWCGRLNLLGEKLQHPSWKSRGWKLIDMDS